MDKDMQATMTEYPDGAKVWRLPSRQIHRDDGPAIEYADGDKHWRLHGKPMCFEEWLDKNTELTDEGKILMKLQYG
jgi:hypothetical protein